MTSLDGIEPAFAALDNCTAALGELDIRCCEPGRSPRMAELGATLTDARVQLRAAATEPQSGVPAAIRVLENAGAQVGRLQIDCCAPDRWPLYSTILENLTKVQLTLTELVSIESNDS